VYTALAADNLHGNDTVIITVKNSPAEDVPYYMGFESSDNYSNYAFINSNGDTVTWKVNPIGGYNDVGCANYPGSKTTASDWMITQCINLEAGKTYQVSFYVRAKMKSFPERLRFAYGTSQSVAGMTTVLKDWTTLNDTNYTQFTVNVPISASGEYYFGWNAYSTSNKKGIFIDDFEITPFVGINENALQKSVTLAPNPATDRVNLRSEHMIRSVNILNMLGQVVHSENVTDRTAVINISSLETGMYYMQIQTSEGMVTKKFNAVK